MAPRIFQVAKGLKLTLGNFIVFKSFYMHFDADFICNLFEFFPFILVPIRGFIDILVITIVGKDLLAFFDKP